MPDFDPLHFLLADELFILDRVSVASESAEETPEEDSEETSPRLEFFGENKAHTLILVDEPMADLLKSREYDFLLKVMAAVRHTPNEFALVNIHRQPELSWEQLQETLTPKQVILFDIASEKITLPLELPNYEVRSHEGVTYLASERLKVLLTDTTRIKKGHLWKSLKLIFAQE